MFRTQQATAEAETWACITPTSETELHGGCLSVAGVRSDSGVAALEVGLTTLIDAQRRYLVASIGDASDRLRLGADLSTATSDHSELQQLIARLAERFVGVAPAALDDTIIEGLRQFADALCVDWAVLWRSIAHDESVVASHTWIKSPERAPSDASRLASVPFIAAALEAGEAAWFAHLDEVPGPCRSRAARATLDSVGDRRAGDSEWRRHRELRGTSLLLHRPRPCVGASGHRTATPALGCPGARACPIRQPFGAAASAGPAPPIEGADGRGTTVRILVAEIVIAANPDHL